MREPRQHESIDSVLPEISREVLAELRGNPELDRLVGEASDSFCDNNPYLPGLMRGYLDTLDLDRRKSAYAAVAFLCCVLEEQAAEKFVETTPEGLPVLTSEVRERFLHYAQNGTLGHQVMATGSDSKYNLLFSGVNYYLAVMEAGVEPLQSTKNAVSFAYLLLGEQSKKRLESSFIREFMPRE